MARSVCSAPSGPSCASPRIKSGSKVVIFDRVEIVNTIDAGSKSQDFFLEIWEVSHGGIIFHTMERVD
jgi:hypothetical protein